MLSFYYKSNISITIRDSRTLPRRAYHSKYHKSRSLAPHYLHLEIIALKNGNKTTSSIQNISTPLVIKEDITRVSSDIASCGPAFFSYLLQCFINAAVDKTNITHEEATTLVSEMVVGMGKLLEKKSSHYLPYKKRFA